MIDTFFRLKEPQQHYEQTVFHGYPEPRYYGKCVRLFEHFIRTDDTFFLENRWLFRRAAPTPSITLSSDTEETHATPSKIKQKCIISNTWRKCIRRVQAFYNKFIHKDINCNKWKT